MPQIQPSLNAPRQRPVSCKFCRVRKLRCSREAPCSNCVSRGIRCDLEKSTRTPEPNIPNNQDIVERLDRLEKLLVPQRSQHFENGVQNANSQTSSTPEPPVPGPSSVPLPHSSIQSLANDVAWLESIYAGLDSSQGTIPTNQVVFKICPIQRFLTAQRWFIQHDPCSIAGSEPTRCIWFPQYEEARVLLEKYLRDVDHYHHITHTTSLSALMKDFYSCLSQQGQIKPGHAILLLSIFASALHSWVPRDCERGLFSTSKEANDQVPWWLKAVQDLLDIAHKSASISIEGIQGIVNIVFVIGNLEGFSRVCLSLFHLGFFLARSLGLHCIDHPDNAHKANTAEAEMGRRIWWYLCAGDWSMAARFHGFAGGISMCQPRQMLTKKPLNINDTDVFDGMNRDEQPLSYPTAMSYSLLRIRLSEISRNIIDRNPVSLARAGGLSLDDVMSIDTELQMLLNDIPAFFSMPKAQLIETYGLSPARAEQLLDQRYMLYLFIYSQRCKLHLPFFNRNLEDAAISISRDICVQSARQIIHFESMADDTGYRVATRYKFTGILLGVFVAVIVLLMKLCTDRSSWNHQPLRKDITESFRLLEEMKADSETAVKFVDTLMCILRKHKVPPSQLTPTHQTQSNVGRGGGGGATSSNAPNTQTYEDAIGASIYTDPSPMLGIHHDSNGATTNTTDGDDLWSCFNDLTQSFEQGRDVNNFDWNSILLTLDTSLT